VRTEINVVGADDAILYIASLSRDKKWKSVCSVANRDNGWTENTLKMTGNLYIDFSASLNVPSLP
jgi:hypothetical protein